MPIYQTNGHLTGIIDQDHVAEAQKYLIADDMTQYLDESLAKKVEHIQWELDDDGVSWRVVVFAREVLTDEESKELSSWISGQNSDGLGEGFEQQDFAWAEDENTEVECSECYGAGSVVLEDGEGGEFEETCGNCGGLGYYEEEDQGHMISFDWTTNNCELRRIK